MDLIKIKRWFKRICLTVMGKGSKAWYKKGNYLYCKSRYNEALDAYDKAMEIQPDYRNMLKYPYAWALFGKGEELSKAGRYNEALNAFNNAIKIIPGFKAACESKRLVLRHLELDR